MRLFEHFNNHDLTVFSNIEEIKQKNIKFDYITLFHVIEHIKDPSQILLDLSKLLNDNGEMIIEVPNSQDAMITLYDSDAYQNFIYWGQHLYIFNEENLISLAKKSNLHLKKIKQIQRYPISNHLYWLAKGLPGGHHKWKIFDTKELNKNYYKKLTSLKACDTLLGVFTN